MIMRVFTARFSGAGRVDCRRCGHGTVFPDSVKAVIYDNGFTMVVVDAEYLEELHRCGREFRWVCEDCGIPREDPFPRPNIRTAPYGNRRVQLHPALACAYCMGRMVQKQVPVSPT